MDNKISPLQNFEVGLKKLEEIAKLLYECEQDIAMTRNKAAFDNTGEYHDHFMVLQSTQYTLAGELAVLKIELQKDNPLFSSYILWN